MRNSPITLRSLITEYYDPDWCITILLFGNLQEKARWSNWTGNNLDPDRYIQTFLNDAEAGVPKMTMISVCGLQRFEAPAPSRASWLHR